MEIIEKYIGIAALTGLPVLFIPEYSSNGKQSPENRAALAKEDYGQGLAEVPLAHVKSQETATKLALVVTELPLEECIAGATVAMFHIHNIN
ncbi:hypothetical protein [Natronoglycomyces albus]|uniref:Uncharacterized protein n=1 Tax=Natronoglycomyces albus TaxID=2811108 RepID=A0A895XGF9_9ACTN|nr:hypothetical protein [Natronoglycomyces albus]QSB03957.1 hypothetical protein JQS30_08975 [Natronoglycomyces albus]